MSFLAAAFFLLARWSQGAAAQSVFKGEDCVRCHARIRDAAPPLVSPSSQTPQAPSFEKPYDVIIVGGGLGGLTASYYLKDLDTLLLEKEDAVGGKVRRETWGGTRYPVAADYIAEPYLAIMKDMFKDLGIAGTAIPEPFNAAFLPDGKVLLDPLNKGLSGLPESEKMTKAVQKMAEDLARFSDGAAGEMPPVPARGKATGLERRLDKTTFWDFMLDRYGIELASFADVYSSSVFGIGAKEVFALAGVIFFAADFGESKNVTWEGGPGVISEKLAERIGSERIETGAFVQGVAQDRSGVWVDYEKGGVHYRKRAKVAIMAVPSFISKRLIRDLPHWKDKALSQVRYSSYAVAVVALNAVVYDSSFDLWSKNYLSTIFTDLIDENWGQAKKVQAPDTPAQILQALIPLGENDGRGLLIAASDDELKEKVLADLERLFPGVGAKLHGMRIIRWGHAMPIDFPKYLTKTRSLVAKPVGRIYFAGVDTELPCVEGAIISGHQGAAQVRRRLSGARR